MHRAPRNKWDFVYAVMGTIIVAGVLLHLFESVIIITFAIVARLLGVPGF